MTTPGALVHSKTLKSCFISQHHRLWAQNVIEQMIDEVVHDDESQLFVQNHLDWKEVRRVKSEEKPHPDFHHVVVRRQSFDKVKIMRIVRRSESKPFLGQSFANVVICLWFAVCFLANLVGKIDRHVWKSETHSICTHVALTRSTSKYLINVPVAPVELFKAHQARNCDPIFDQNLSEVLSQVWIIWLTREDLIAESSPCIDFLVNDVTMIVIDLAFNSAWRLICMIAMSSMIVFIMSWESIWLICDFSFGDRRKRKEFISIVMNNFIDHLFDYDLGS